MMPIVIEKTPSGERAYDLPSRMMKDRILFLDGAVDQFSANILVMQLLFLENQDPKKTIKLYINSPGGSVVDGLAIYDTMQLINAPVETLCIGQASSMGAVLLAAGEEGHRFALPNSRIMIHQPSGGFGGQETDIRIQAREIEKYRSRLEEILATHTGQKKDQVTKDCERDNFMDATEAKKYGIIDAIITAKVKPKTKSK